LYEKVFDRHTVRRLPSGQYQLLIGLHLVHEVTSPQAFEMLRERSLGVLAPHRTFATVDHIIPTANLRRPLADPSAEEMVAALESNVASNDIQYLSHASGKQGIVHVIGPELGLTQPGMTICCGDSHTSTHGAFGAIAFGIGTSQVRDVLAAQSLAVSKLKVRRVEIAGRLRPFVYAKDVALHVIRQLGVKGGVGYAYEFGGGVVDAFTMDERMTLCNMSIEGGARCGYVNPDETTYDYLRGRPAAPGADAWGRAVEYWESLRSGPDARYDDVVRIDGGAIEPMVTWGITPGQSMAVNGSIPRQESFAEDDRPSARAAYEYMAVRPGGPIKGMKINVAFIGSCTNGRLSDYEEVAKLVSRAGRRVAPGVRALVAPGSQQIARDLVRLGYHEALVAAGFDVRDPGCSMCIAMNGDQLNGDEVCASSSNRNFKGRQGSPSGRTLLMSPVMVAAAALAGEVADAREVFGAAAG
jgi:3-isopropylmalate/(R)-2-methylmalate dehydratase large subunit